MLNITTDSYTDHAVSTPRFSSHLSSLSLPRPSRQKHPDLSDSLVYPLVDLMPLFYLPVAQKRALENFWLLHSTVEGSDRVHPRDNKDNRRIDLDERIRTYVHSKRNQSIATDCRTFWPCRPLSTAYKMCTLWSHVVPLNRPSP